MAGKYCLSDIYKIHAQKYNMPMTQSKMIVDSVLDVIAGALEEGWMVKLMNFGTFEVKMSKEKVVQNRYNSGDWDDMVVPSRAQVKFRAADALKDAVRESHKAAES